MATAPTKTNLIAELRAAGCTLAESTLKRKTVAGLQEMLDAALQGDEPEQAESTTEPAEQPEEAALVPDAVFAARGNYNTVWVPLAVLLADDPRFAVRVWTDKVSTMLVNVNIAGSGSEQFHDLLTGIEDGSLTALKAWQRTQDREGQTDMEKYNQNRSFLAGFGAGVAARLASSKKPPVVAFARDMEKADRPDARKAGVAAGKDSEVGK